MTFDPQSNRIGDAKDVQGVQREPRRARGDGLVFFLVVAGMLGGGWFCIENGSVGAAATITPTRVAASTTRRPVVTPDAPQLEPVPADAADSIVDEVDAADSIVIEVGDDDEIVDAALRRGRLLCGLGRYREAIPVLDEAVAVDPDAADVRYQLALAHIRTRDLHSARVQLAKLEELDPSLANLLKNLVQ